MGERIAFVSWDYLRLVCDLHGAELELTLKGNRTLYSCTDSGCSVALPTELYEKLLEDVVNMQNNGPLMLGYRWKRKSKGEAFEFVLTWEENGETFSVSAAPVISQITPQPDAENSLTNAAHASLYAMVNAMAHSPVIRY